MQLVSDGDVTNDPQSRDMNIWLWVGLADLDEAGHKVVDFHQTLDS